MEDQRTSFLLSLLAKDLLAEMGEVGTIRLRDCLTCRNHHLLSRQKLATKILPATILKQKG